MEQLLKRKLSIVPDEQSFKERRVVYSEQSPCSCDSGVSSLDGSSDVSEDDFFICSGLALEERQITSDLICEEDEDLESCFDFLNSKQTILTRLSEVLAREDKYTASTAMKAAKKTCFPSSILMKEARSVLWNLGLRANAFEPQIVPTLSPKYISKARKSPKHPEIDVSHCELLPADVWKSRQKAIQSQQRGGTNTLLNLPRSIFCEGQWMAQALVWSAPSIKQQKETDLGDQFLWKVISNPMTQSLGLLPPTGISMENAIDIEEAVSISDEARIVTQSTPPFCVVYANKAFLELSCVQSKDLIIGRPVETIIQVPMPSDICTDTAGSDMASHSEKKYLNGRLCLAKDLACQISVTPVVDQNRKNEAHRSKFSSVKSTGKNTGVYSCMSHILIQVY
ncbi:hypothetical protein FisN_15Lh035 [Fistulifera solaris]|uniref:Uncharacterized protein n=1 Tax=Fistulifera solaris TaxID=1519565 RepID=A0A1Z5KHF5_FISSO|nr:hypothetical protein FisN_15Lh035 [Fistulifera solaris]|eukprot:GAX25666.1 hypothetical protein FisN_15Lh035 [Fistulifera solaris]